MERFATMKPIQVQAPGQPVVVNLGTILVRPYQGIKVLQNTNAKITVPTISLGAPVPPFGNIGGVIRVLKQATLKTNQGFLGNISVQGKLDTDGFLNLGTGSRLTSPTSPTINGDVFNSAGNLVVGGPTSASGLALTGTSGTYCQENAAALSINIGGTTPGTEYDHFAIGALATLDGTLNLSLLTGYTPSVGNTFQVLTYGSCIGTFSSITGQVFASGSMRFELQYNATNLTLTAVSNSSPPSVPTVTAVSGRSKPATSGRFKTSHFEERRFAIYSDGGPSLGAPSWRITSAWLPSITSLRCTSVAGRNAASLVN
jgi:hypothetical protein